MSAVVAIGDREALEGLALVGVRLVPAATPTACVEAWNSLGADVGMVILSADAAAAIGTRRGRRDEVLSVVTP